MKLRLIPCLLVIICLLSILLLLLINNDWEFFGGGFAMRGGGGGGGMRGFGGGGAPAMARPAGPMPGPRPGPPPGPPPPPPPGPPRPPGPPGPRPRPYPRPGPWRGYGGVGWGGAGIPAYRYFADYPLAYSTSYALETQQCLNNCCDVRECQYGNCKFTSNDKIYLGETPQSCIEHKKCVADEENKKKLKVEELEAFCAEKSKSRLID